MEKLKRYEIDIYCHAVELTEEEKSDGDWCKSSDVTALEARHAMSRDDAQRQLDTADERIVELEKREDAAEESVRELAEALLDPVDDALRDMARAALANQQEDAE